ncbi:CAP10 domain-containing protein [Mycena sanguinolenta]|uniref:CAP10 domain-containing protein n=1 Tax=Mycena sanguinolenta TaxID=230812 RepID=A0A8H6Y7D7_9AGAR|nr:CAP10 domain-containing protein [Mycena sanguinolenta]
MNLFASLSSRFAYSRVPSQPNARFRQTQCRISLFTVAIVLGGVFCFFVVNLYRRGSGNTPLFSPAAHIEELFNRQSASLEQAIARYVLRNGRLPPRTYDQWYSFAKSRECLIDDYDQIQRDFEPFYQMAQKDPNFFKKMLDRGTELAISEDLGMKTFRVEGRLAETTDTWNSNYDSGWMFLLKNISAFLPDMNLVFNHRDEPRVVFDVRIPDTQSGAFAFEDQTPFRNQPRPTAKFYTEEKHCLVPNAPKGFLEYANDANSFLQHSASADFTTDLYPVLSQAKIYPCFADILFPSEFHYGRSPKEPVLYWRGQSTGGWISGTNYHSFPRFKLIDIARGHAGLMDVAISTFYEWFCQLDGCDAARIKAEYNITGENAPREDVYRYKYVFDVDGNSFSGRYLGLLRSGSLVFKSTVFREYFDDWLQPFVHYIPVLPDLSDLVERIEWARTHDAEAQRIQLAGQEFAERVMTDGQNDCYFFLVLLEWARLQSGLE